MRKRKRRGDSLNQTVMDVRRRELGTGPQRKSNGLAALAGAWTAEECAVFDRAVQEVGEQIDEELWR
jgi:hypothetical protein